MPRQKGKTLRQSQGKKGGQAIQNYQQEGVSPLAGAAMGAAVGGAIGAAAAVVLSDKDKREKLKDAASNLRDQAIDKMQDMKGKAQNVAEVTKEEAKKQLGAKSSDKKKAA